MSCDGPCAGIWSVRLVAKMSWNRSLERKWIELCGPHVFSTINYCKQNSPCCEQGAEWDSLHILCCSTELCGETFSRKEGPRTKLNCQAAKRGVCVYSPFRYRMGPPVHCMLHGGCRSQTTIQRHWMPPSYSFWFNNSREQRKTYFSCVSTSLTTKTRAIARRKALCCQVLF